MNTYKFFFVLNLFFGFGPTLLAQCDGFDVSTFTHTTALWDWRDFNESNWTAHLKTDIAGQYVTRTLPNPWSPANGIPFLNTVHLGTGPDFDYEPADGWELIYKSFGANAATLAVETPTFILYNRFNSILRIFLWIPGNKGQLNRAGVSVSFDEALLKASALLDVTISPFRTLKDFEKKITATSINSYNMATDGEWLFGDFPVAYDPCTCHKGVDNTGNLTENISALNVNAQLMSVSVLEGNSFQVPQTPTPSAATGMVANTSNPINIKDGVTFFKSVLALHGKLTSTQDKVASPAKAGNNATLGTGTTPIASGGGNNAQTTTQNRWPDFAQNTLLLTAAYLSLDFLFTGGKEAPKPSSSQVSGVSGTKYSGNISWSGSSMLGGYFYTPGSNYESLSPPPLQKPIYDYVLGVFNLLETPVLEFSTFEVSSSVNKNLYGCSTGSSTLPAVFPRIYQYKLKTPLKYVINPASQLEVVSIDAALVYEIGTNEANISVDTTLQLVREIGISPGPSLKSPLAFYGPVSMTKLGSRYDNLSFVQRLNESGIQVDLWPKADITTFNNNSKGINDAGKITYSTGFYPFQCLDDQRVLLAIPSPSPGADSLANRLNFGDFTYEPQFKLKLKVLLKRTDTEAINTNTEYVVIMASYQVKLESANTSPGTYYVSHLTPWTTPVCNQTAKYMKDYVVTSLFSPSGTPITEIGGNGLPMDISLTGVEITTDREALRKITLDNCWIGSSQTFIPPPPSTPEEIIYGPPVIIRAGESIEVLSSSNTSNLFQTASLLVGVPSRFGGCDGSPLPPPASATEIQSFCENGSLYKPYILPNKLAGSNLSENLIPLTAFPNPFTGEITLRFELLQTTEVSIALYDLLGRPVMPIRKAELMKAGPQELTVDMGFLAAGVYIVVMDAEGQRRTVRIVKE